MGIGIWGEGSKVAPVAGKKDVSKAYKSETSNTQGKKDNITISGNAKDFNMITKLLKDVPDVREDKVKDLKDRFDNGKYNVADTDVADKILEHFGQQEQQQNNA